MYSNTIEQELPTCDTIIMNENALRFITFNIIVQAGNTPLIL